MKSGEVAVENSVNAFRELKSGKLKDRAVAAQYLHYDNRQHHLRHRHSMPHQQYLAQYPPQPYPPFQPLQYQPQASAAALPALPLYAQRVQPVMPAYHRYNSAAPVVNYGVVPPHRTHQDQLHGGTKRNIRHQSNQQPPPPPPTPVSAPLPASAPPEKSSNEPVEQPVCNKFAVHGTCHYGAACKYSHGLPKAKEVPSGSAGPNKRRVWAAAETQTDISHSTIDDTNFPSLSTDARKSASENRSGRSNGDNQSPERGPASPPSKQLVFRDAVLKHQRRPDYPDWKCPSENPASRGGGSSDEESEGSNNNQSSDEEPTQELPTKAERGRIASEGTHTEDRPHTENGGTQHTHDALRRTDNIPAPKSNDDAPPSKQRAPPTHNKQMRTRVIEPELGQSGYAVYPVYTMSQSYASDDSTTYSALSRDAHHFVHRIDSKLRSIACHQHKALAKLQDLVHTLWPDAAVDVYGSNFTRLALPRSDVDCVLSSSSTEEPAEMLRKLADELQQQSWAKRVELLDSAKIPVLKIVYCIAPKSKTEVMLDLTCAHSPGHSGLSARTLIYSYQVEMPALRPLVLILKSHIHRHGLNVAFTGGLSSYGLVLLVIRFLQACGDEHHVVEPLELDHGRETGRSRSSSENSVLSLLGSFRHVSGARGTLIYEFTRGGKLTWRTGLGNMLLLFLETYVTFDYRRFGISTANAGEYFPLPVDKISLEPGAVVSPYIVDPIKITRSIGSCFRMHEIIQAWYALYQLLMTGVSIEDAIAQPVQASPAV